MNNKVLIQLDNICKSFYTDEIETQALLDINFTVNNGDYISISGYSGCGKSTFLSLLGLLDTPTAGNYFLVDQDVSNLDQNRRAEIRNEQIGFVFQSFNLISDMSVAENVKLPLTYRSDLSKNQIEEMVNFALDKVEMGHRVNHFPSQLSGGQQQRVAVARAIVGKPSIILADEPTGNLDSKNADIVIELLEKLHHEGATIIMVTHNPETAERASRQVEMLDGRIVKDLKRAKSVVNASQAKAAVNSENTESTDALTV